MEPIPLFLLQFSWFLIAWSAVALFLVRPAIHNLDTPLQLSVWAAPHMFRVLGVGLLVQNLSPGLPLSFALPTAIGDSTTAVLALASLATLHQRWRHARKLVWVFNIVGSIDLTVAMVHAGRIHAATYLQGQWYVPALVVPLMAVAHVMVFHTLVTTGREQKETPA